MAQSIVDLFETFEIDHQDRAIAFGSAKRGKRRLDRVGHAVAVRQTIARIDLRKSRGFLLALMLPGYVGAGAAKADRQGVVGGTSVSVRVVIGVRLLFKH